MLLRAIFAFFITVMYFQLYCVRNVLEEEFAHDVIALWIREPHNDGSAKTFNMVIVQKYVDKM